MATGFSSESEERDVGNIFRSAESCSVCLDAVTDSGERSVAKLQCGHHFHLDCIGSAFNAKGAMQCPNCRHVEDGRWLYANGLRWSNDFTIEESLTDDEYLDQFQPSPPVEVHVRGRDALGHYDWCPFQHGSSIPGSGIGVDSSFQRFHINLGERDAVSWVGNFLPLDLQTMEPASASSPPPFCPHLVARLAAHASHRPEVRPAQFDALRARSVASLRPTEQVATATSGSVIGDGGGVFGGPSRSIWGTRTHQSNAGYDDDGQVGAEQPTRFSSEVETAWSTTVPFFGDPGTSSYERHRSWSYPISQPETQRATGLNNSSFGTHFTPVAGHFSYSGLHLDDGLPPLLCPRPYYLNGPVGTSQSQLGRRGRGGGIGGSGIGSPGPFVGGGSTAAAVPPFNLMNRMSGVPTHRADEFSRIRQMNDDIRAVNGLDRIGTLNESISQSISTDAESLRLHRSFNDIHRAFSDMDHMGAEEPPVPGLDEFSGFYYHGDHNMMFPWRTPSSSGPPTGPSLAVDPWPTWRSMPPTGFGQRDFPSIDDSQGLQPRSSGVGPGETLGTIGYTNFAEPSSFENAEIGSISSHSWFL